MAPRPIRSYAFGPFRLDPDSRTLTRDGALIPLAPKAFELLLVLIENNGKVVRHEELMQAIWPDAFVEEGNIKVNIFAIRKALGNGEGEGYVQTVPRRGYRFSAAVSEYGREIAAVEPEHVPPGTRTAGKRPVPKAAAIVIGALALAALAFLLRPALPPPRALRLVQLTHFGRAEPGGAIVTDGARIFFTRRQGGHWDVVQTPVEGGDPVPVHTPFPSAQVVDITPRKGELLVATSNEQDSMRQLWLVPVTGGPPRRFGDISSRHAAWSPDGEKLVYTRDSDLYVSNRDGTESRQLASLGGPVLWPRWSTDGRLIRFTVADRVTNMSSLWELSVGGNRPRRIYAATERGPWRWGESHGTWIRDGEYFVFCSHSGAFGGDHATNIWAIREKQPRLRRREHEPVQLYTTALDVAMLAAGPDGRSIIFLGNRESRELARYDTSARQFVPYAGGLASRALSFSRDGQWIAYTASPAGTLWRAKATGLEASELTFTPMLSLHPRWSPDGERIAFCGSVPGQPPRVYVIPANGGQAEMITRAGDTEDNPNWSPDGRRLLVLSGRQSGSSGYAVRRLEIVDLTSHQRTALPGSEGMGDPSWSFDGRFVAAHSLDGKRMLIYDFRSGKWKTIAEGTLFSGGFWSRDSRFVYFQDFYGSEQPIRRYHPVDRKMEHVTSAAPLLPAGVAACSLAGLAPDGSPLVTLIRTNADLYALEVDLP